MNELIEESVNNDINEHLKKDVDENVNDDINEHLENDIEGNVNEVVNIFAQEVTEEEFPKGREINLTVEEFRAKVNNQDISDDKIGKMFWNMYATFDEPQIEEAKNALLIRPKLLDDIKDAILNDKAR